MNEVRQPRPSLFRRVALAVAPGVVVSRERKRIELDRLRFQSTVLDHATRLFRAGYQGASTEVGYSYWNPGGGSADSDLIPDLPKLRERSRDLVRSDPHAAGLVDTWVGQIAGLRPQSRIDREEIGLTEGQAEKFQNAAERIWEYWGREADVSGRLDVLELQELVLRSFFENGDSFLIPRPLGRRRFKTAVQVVEADRVSTPPNKYSNDKIREGVLIGPEGQHEGYYVKTTHPGDYPGKTDDFVLVPRLQGDRQVVYQVISIRRPDQSRGVPFMAPSLLAFKDLAGYQRAELVGAKVAASYALFITMNDPLLDTQSAATAAALVDSTRQTAPGGASKEYVYPGMIRRLNPGENVVSANPNRPNTAYPDFVERVLRSIGSAVQMPYEDLAHDFSKSNYSSARAALTAARRVYRKIQRWFARKYLQPIWELVLEEAILMGELEAPRFEEYREAYFRASWVGEGWDWVDPSKEISATETALDRNLTTLADEAASKGKDWQELLTQRAREKEFEKSLGLVPEAPAMDPAQPDGGAAPDEDQEEEPDADPPE